jgi:hypothetical protein
MRLPKKGQCASIGTQQKRPFAFQNKCGTSVVYSGHPATRASQSREGGLRLEPGGNSESFAQCALSCLSLTNAMRRHGSGKHTKAVTVLLR